MELKQTTKNVSFRDTSPLSYGYKIINNNRKVIIDCRIYGYRYGGRRCAIWICNASGVTYLGVGHATGHGYELSSASVALALQDMGIPADFGGKGMDSAIKALRDLAEQLGHKVLVEVDFNG